MNCTGCGKGLSAGENFCATCGTPARNAGGNTGGYAGGAYGPQTYHTGNAYVSKPTNTMCLLGFIFSFILPLVGLILSIIGLNQVNKRVDAENGKGLAIAGIIISAIAIFLVILMIIIAIIVGSFWVDYYY